MADVKLGISEWQMAMDQYWDKVRSMEARKSLFPLMKFPENMQLTEWQFVEQRIEELELETELVQLMDQHEESSVGKKKRRRIGVRCVVAAELDCRPTLVAEIGTASQSVSLSASQPASQSASQPISRGHFALVWFKI